jgi:hypothetical protein
MEATKRGERYFMLLDIAEVKAELTVSCPNWVGAITNLAKRSRSEMGMI